MKKTIYGLILAAAVGLSTIYPALAAPGPAGHAHADADASHGGSGTDGSPGNPAQVDRVVRVDALDTTFNVKQIQVRPGETIKFVVTDKSSIPHEFVIASQKEHLEHRQMMQQMAGMKMDDEPNAVSVEPGQTKELVWKFGNDKDVAFACDIPGHAEMGMVGTFRVVE